MLFSWANGEVLNNVGCNSSAVQFQGSGEPHVCSQVDEGLASGIRGIEWDAVELPSQVPPTASLVLVVGGDIFWCKACLQVVSSAHSMHNWM